MDDHTKFDPASLEQYRTSSHTHEVPPKEFREYPDIYVNGCDAGIVTKTVDPMKNASWIVDGDGRHVSSVHRGAIKDHDGVMRALRLLDQHEAPKRTFMPTSKMIDPMHKLSGRARDNPKLGRDNTYADDGELPIYSKMIYENKLPYKLEWLAEREQWLSESHMDRRRFHEQGDVNWIRNR